MNLRFPDVITDKFECQLRDTKGCLQLTQDGWVWSRMIFNRAVLKAISVNFKWLWMHFSWSTVEFCNLSFALICGLGWLRGIGKEDRQLSRCGNNSKQTRIPAIKILWANLTLSFHTCPSVLCEEFHVDIRIGYQLVQNRYQLRLPSSNSIGEQHVILWKAITLILIWATATYSFSINGPITLTVLAALNRIFGTWSSANFSTSGRSCLVTISALQCSTIFC